jgi:hypothetical protein
MLKHFAIALALFASLAATQPSFVQAQDMQDSTYQNAPATDTNNAPSGTTTNNDRNNFNWWWLLPLMAIPLVFMMKRDNKRERRDGRYATGGQDR